MKEKVNKKEQKKIQKFIYSILICAFITIIAYYNPNFANYITNLIQTESASTTIVSFDLNSIPEYENKPYVYINDNIPKFSESDYTNEGFEKYSEFDVLGRCGVAFANVCKETMPPIGDKRGEISEVVPTGWKQKKYNGEFLYNRCHLIGWQLTDEDANKQNLITGTRYMNVEGMLPFENMIADYLKQKTTKNNHVLYRVTPIFKNQNLVANGVQMEAYSIEDNGEGVQFNVYVYNVQPGIEINYQTGESKMK